MMTLQEGVILAQCSECSNKAEVWADDPRPLCEYCLCNEEAPEIMHFYNAHFTGNPVAACTQCNFKSVNWECAHDLQHECSDY